MLVLGLAPNKLRTNNVSNTVSHKDGGSHETLLGVSRNIRHADGDDETHSPAKEASDGVSHHGRRSTVRPLALPDDGAPGDDGEAGEDQHEDADVVELCAQPSREEDDDEAESAKGELEQDRVEGAPAKGRHDQRAESAHGAVDGVCRRHHQGDQPDLDVEDGFPELRRLEGCASHTGLAMPETLHGSEPLLLGQEPSRHGRVWHDEAEEAKEKRQRPCEEVDVLPPLEAAARDLGKAIVERAADDGEDAGRREPPALPQRLLGLGVVPGDDAHEARGDDALDEAQEEALHVQALVRRDGGGQHADGGPDDHDAAEDAADVEALEGEGHGVQAGQHAKVEERGGPAETAGVDCRGGGRGVDDGEVEVGGHAKEDGRAEDGLVVVDEAIYRDLAVTLCC